MIGSILDWGCAGFGDKDKVTCTEAQHNFTVQFGAFSRLDELLYFLSDRGSHFRVTSFLNDFGGMVMQQGAAVVC